MGETRRIWRAVVRYEEYELAENEDICPTCNGKALISKYDEGWHSPFPSRELSAMRECLSCQGTGIVEKGAFVLRPLEM